MCILSISLLFAINPERSFTQPNTFNQTLIFNDTLVDESASQVLETDEGFILCGITDYTYHTMVLAGIDFAGNILWKKYYGKDRRHLFRPGFYDSMIKTSDSNYALAVSFKDTLLSPSFSMMIMKFDAAGDTLWTKSTYTSPTPGQSCYARGIIETYDKGFLVFGDEKYKGVLIKTDSAGNREWLVYLGNNSYNDSRNIYSACQTRDSGFILGDYRDNIPNLISGNPVVVRYNKSGTKIWEKGFGGPYHDPMGTFIKPVNDSIYMATAHYTLSTSGPPYYIPEESQIQQIQISDNGEVLSNTLIGDSGLMLEVNDLEEMTDGTFMAVGETWDHKSWLMNFSTENKCIFFRMLDIPSKPDYMTSLYDVMNTRDGSIVACGWYYLFGAGGNDKPWLFKTDRFGCFDIGCDSTSIYLLKQPVSDTLCKNDHTLLSLETLCIQGVASYQWQYYRAGRWVNTVDGPVYQGSNDDTLTIDPAMINNKTEYYRCNFYNDFWSFFTESVPVFFLDTVTIISQPQSFSVPLCYTVKFIVDQTGDLPVNYQWYHNSMPMENATDSMLTVQNVLEPDTGIYYCMVENICGNVKSDDARLRIFYLGIEKEKERVLIDLSPNPANGILNIYSSEEIFLETLMLFNLSGQPLMEMPVGSKIRQDLYLDISFLSPGIYLLSIQTDKERIIRKVVKN